MFKEKIIILSLLCSNSVLASELSEAIRLNQVGFYPQAPKIAIVVGAPAECFHLVNKETGDTLFYDNLSQEKVWSPSGECVRAADFSAFHTPGRYTIEVPELGHSHAFEIRPYVHQQIGTAALKAFYYQRASMALEPEYAGKWQRKMGHPDDAVHIHESAATETRPRDTVIACPRGWYDAGDYNKYIVNSGISTYQVLAAWEHFSQYCNKIVTRIPESNNGVPDILDEALWNVRWMLTMQDPGDGGVYHKCTCANFQGFVMPHLAKARRYAVQKSSTAALDFAAVMAQASRIYRQFEQHYTGLADSCLDAALRAWQWAQQNPRLLYRQSEINDKFDPDINTGEYGDSRTGDERDWAAIELFITTGADSFLTGTGVLENIDPTLPAWPNVRTLGYYSLAHRLDELPVSIDAAALRGELLDWADELRSGIHSSAYRIVMGARTGEFGWGSNAVAANQSMALLTAFKLTADSTYLWDALSNLDYLLGRNATGYCFVTGAGSRSPMNIHHRQSGSDGIKEPVPGLLAGGPNPEQQDKNYGVDYPSDLPAKSYADVEGSWASNEICINWNAPLVYVTLALEAILSPDGNPGPIAGLRDIAAAPQGIILYPGFPNPFNSGTRIRFDLDQPQTVRMAIYNLNGQQLKILQDGVLEAGRHTLFWDGTGRSGTPLASALYLCRVESSQYTRTIKLLLLK